MRPLVLPLILVFGGFASGPAEVLRVPDQYPTIQEGIWFAEEGDTVLLAPGTYTGEGNKGVHFRAYPITVLSETGPAATVVDCQGSGRGFIFNRGQPHECRLEGVTVRNGGGVNKGGGIFCSDSSPTIEGCRLINNRADLGGGLHVKSGEPVITHCTINENTATQRGGGIGIFDESEVEVLYCTVSSNTVYRRDRPFRDYMGGGIFSGRSEPFISNCQISGNKGGGVRFFLGEPLIAGCIIERNLSNDGAGLFLDDTTPQIVNCTIYGNHGIYPYDYVGGIYATSDSYAMVVNSIIWNNTGSEIRRVRGRVKVRYSNVQDGEPGFGNLKIYPEFADTAESDFHILERSPCINAGYPVDLETDFDGDPRILGGRIDIGADEARLDGPVLKCMPWKFIHFDIRGGNPSNDTLELANVGTDTLRYTLDYSEPEWLRIQGRLSGALASGDTTETTLIYSVDDLPVGTYDDTIKISSNDIFSSMIRIPVSVRIYSEGKLVVPDQFNCIRHAVHFATHGDTILVRDGTYSGPGNTNIDNYSKKLFFISENGPSKTIIDCKEAGRAFYFYWSHPCLIQGFKIKNGVDSRGGAIYGYDVELSIRDCWFEGNFTEQYAGCLYISWSDLRCENCSFLNNFCVSTGAAVYLIRANALVKSCIFFGNRAGTSGGAIHLSTGCGEVRIRSCTFAENISDNDGGIISKGSSGLLNMRNCIMWDQGETEIFSESGVRAVNYSDIRGGWEGIGNIDEDPRFVDLEGGNLELEEDSPCIDLGDPEAVPVPWGGDRVDMGANEFDKGWYLDPDSGIRVWKPSAEPCGLWLHPLNLAGCVEPGKNLQGTIRITNFDLEPRAFDEVQMLLTGPGSLEWLIHEGEEIVLERLVSFDIDFEVEIPLATECGVYQVEIAALLDSVTVGTGFGFLRISEFCSHEVGSTVD